MNFALFAPRRGLGSDLTHQEGHRPTADGPQAHALLGPESFAPDDILTRPDYYTGFWRLLTPVWPRIRRAQGQPEALIPIYRALDARYTTFHPGDWVSISSTYADNHRAGEKGWHTIAVSVPAHTLRWAGDDLMEWGYYGPPVQGRVLR